MNEGINEMIVWLHTKERRMLGCVTKERKMHGCVLCCLLGALL